MAVIVILVVYVFGLVTAGVFFVKMVDQRAKDRQRVSKIVHAPSDLDIERLQAFVQAFNGTIRRRGILPAGVHSLVFELQAEEDSFTYRMRIPWQHLGFVEQQLYTLIPGLHLTDDPDLPPGNLTRVREYRMTARSMPLRTESPEDVSHSILASGSHLQAGEMGLVQIIAIPMEPRSLPQHDKTDRDITGFKDLLYSAIVGAPASKDQVDAARKKAERPNMLICLRIAASANTEARADHIIHQLEAAINQTRSPYTYFKRVWATQESLRRRVADVSAPVTPRCQFTDIELAALIAWPYGSPYLPGLSPVRTRPMPASASIPNAGRVIGTTNMPSRKRPVALAYNQAVRHMYWLGPNGSGKSTGLLNSIVQDINEGYGVFIIETKNTADLFYGALDVLPDWRIPDLHVIDVDDAVMPVGFNIFDQDNSRTSIDELSGIISELYADGARSLLAPQVLHHMLHALAEVEGQTLIDLPILLNPQTQEQEDWQEWLATQVKDKDVRAYLDRYRKLKPTERERLAGPVYNRTWEFTSRPEIRRILGQRTSSFKIADALRENRIVLIKVSGGGVGKQSAMMAGTLLANAIWSAAQRTKVERPNFLYLDEFQDIAKFPIGLEDMLAKARSAKLGTVLAHQNIAQLRRELQSAVMANAMTKVFFKPSSEDARIVAREFGRHVTDQDFLNLPAFHAITTVSTDHGVSSPVTVETLPPPTAGKKPEELLARRKEILAVARGRDGRPMEDVELQLEPRPGKSVVSGTRQRPERPDDPMRDE